jgi:hypothetical protein
VSQFGLSQRQVDAVKHGLFVTRYGCQMHGGHDRE